MSEVPRRDFTTTEQDVVERVHVGPPEGKLALPEEDRPLVFIDVIHDGNWIPPQFLIDSSGNAIGRDRVWADYVRERDWGASAVAERLAQSLGLESYSRVNIARVLMDFGRFPGSTPRHADHLHRFAVNYPFSQLLSYRQKRDVLEDYYDRVSDAIEEQIAGKLLKIAIHTYDQYNESGTERPASSVMTTALGYHTQSEMPAGLFDPLYPDVLAEFTCDRVLRDRVSLTLEKKGIPVAHNYPYLLPDGSLEVRYQVWAFFRALRDAFEDEHPETRAEAPYEMVWRMLFDTNLRSSESEALRSFMHMYRRPPAGREAEFAAAEEAYEAVEDFCQRKADFIRRYRFSRRRTSSIAIEFRKDLVCELDDHGVPRAVRDDNVALFADALAEAVATYFRDDREPHVPPTPDLERHTPWDGPSD